MVLLGGLLAASAGAGTSAVLASAEESSSAAASAEQNSGLSELSTETITTTVTVTPSAVSGSSVDLGTVGLIGIPLVAGALALNASLPSAPAEPRTPIQSPSVSSTISNEEVTPAPTESSVAPVMVATGPQLANTGGAVAQIVGVAILIVLLGAITFGMGNRRK
ncbi:MAG: hypothetical protein Q3962_07420 [Corynebacterium sp.]|nr:hypothetical protein [Corynebacterium sp.]